MKRALLTAIAAAWLAEPASAQPGAGDSGLRLWYQQPALRWTEALPVGNGRLGAMVFGGLADERLQINEDTVWTGEPREYQHEGAVHVLPELRRLLFEGKQKEAEELATREFMSVPLRQKAYQPMGDLLLRFAGHQAAADYRRELDLDQAVASVSYRVGDIRYLRQAFASYPDQVLAERLTASRQAALAFSATLTSPHQGFLVQAVAANEIALAGRVKDGAVRFEIRLRVVAEGGRVAVEDGRIAVSGADAATLLISAATNFVNFRDVSAEPGARAGAAMRAAAAKDHARLRASHVADHRRLFGRVSLDLGTTEAADLPTDERIAAADKTRDPQLVTLAFQYGRYLLIASSRKGDQPANLQGIWNDSLAPPWDSKYTVNINTEMNYWPAEVANLAECAEPLFAMLDDLVVSGRKTAAAHYGARGFVLHHNTDLWRGTAPINAANHGIWPTGGAWLTQQLWWHYQFSGDREFLRARAYPVMKEAALFFVDALVRDPKSGRLISGPSNSPENGGLVMGPTMDHQIIRALFGSTAEAARVLKIDAELADQLDALRAEIAPNRIGRLGQLQEWLEDRDDPENKHRHVSHLWGVFPGEEITPLTRELFEAARKSLFLRGDDGTGWSLGWKIAFWARFKDGDHALRMIERLLTSVKDEGTRMSGGGTYPNLFDAHPPFQIDGNFALTAGVAEMLVQSHHGTVVLLPALPSPWRNGSVKGLRARGGRELDLRWWDGKLIEAGIVSTSSDRVRLEYRDSGSELALRRGARAVWRPR